MRAFFIMSLFLEKSRVDTYALWRGLKNRKVLLIPCSA